MVSGLALLVATRSASAHFPDEAFNAAIDTYLTLCFINKFSQLVIPWLKWWPQVHQ